MCRLVASAPACPLRCRPHRPDVFEACVQPARPCVITLDPAPALRALKRPGPHPSIENSQGQPLRRDGVVGMPRSAQKDRLPGPSSCCSWKSSSAVSCRQNTTGCAAMLTSGRAMCGASTAFQPRARSSLSAWAEHEGYQFNSRVTSSLFQLEIMSTDLYGMVCA